MLSGDIAQTSGSAHIEGHDIVLEQVQIRRYIGYCPQHDALLELLSVRQHLQLFARIKGVGGGGGWLAGAAKRGAFGLGAQAPVTARAAPG